MRPGHRPAVGHLWAWPAQVEGAAQSLPREHWEQEVWPYQANALTPVLLDALRPDENPIQRRILTAADLKRLPLGREHPSSWIYGILDGEPDSLRPAVLQATGVAMRGNERFKEAQPAGPPTG